MAVDTISKDEINSVLKAGGFLFEKKLGEGAFGTVVSATHSLYVEPGEREVGLTFAIKLMKFHSNQPQLLKYQRRELELLTKPELSDPNIIRYFRFWEHQQILAIQMELCFNSLTQILFNIKNYPEGLTEAMKQGRFYQHVFPQILSGLDAIHTLEWVHRDIHPGNILVANNNPQQVEDIVIKIADFGLARHIGPMTTNLSARPEFEDLSAMEHSLFRAPEISTRKYDHKVDLYSAGIVLYTLSGHSEHDRASWEKNITELRFWAASNSGELTLRQLGLNDEILLTLLVKLLNAKPEERPSARECRESLVKSLTTKTDGAPPTHTPKPVPTVLVKRKGEASYDRCNIRDDSFVEFQEKIKDLTHIQPENQKICEERYDGAGSPYFINVTCDENLKDMLMSAKNSQDRRPVRVVVESREKSTPQEMPGGTNIA